MISFFLENPINIKASGKSNWVLFVVIFCITPYILRLFFSVAWSDELDGFFISEMDILCFCIAIMVHLFSEVKRLYKTPRNMESSTFLGYLTLYIIFLFVCVFFSLDFEHHIVVLREKYEVALIAHQDAKELLASKSWMETKKLFLFVFSLLLGVLTPLFSYKILFGQKNG